VPLLRQGPGQIESHLACTHDHKSLLVQHTLLAWSMGIS
jgi:hypothetical protein